MKIFKYLIALTFLSFNICVCQNSKEFKEAIVLIKSADKYNANKVLAQLQTLIKANKDILKEKEDETGNTLLHYSKQIGYPSLNDWLIKQGIDIYAKNAQGLKAEELASQKQLKKEEKLRHIMEYKASKRRIEKEQDASKGTNSVEFQDAIHLFKNEKKPQTLLSKLHKLIEKHPQIIKEQEDGTGNTLLHYSKQKGWPSVNDYLIRKGADINAENYEGQTPEGFAGELSLEKEQEYRTFHKKEQDRMQEENKLKEEIRKREQQEYQEKRKRDEQEQKEKAKKKKQEEDLFEQMMNEPMLFDDFELISMTPYPHTAYDAYNILGLSFGEPWNDVVAAWRRIALIVHPDVNSNRYDQANENTQKINAAYDILKEHCENQKNDTVVTL